MKKRNVALVVVLALLVGWLVNEAGMLSRWQTAVYSLSAPSPARVEPAEAERVGFDEFIGGANEMSLIVTPMRIDLSHDGFDSVSVVGEAQGGAMPNERHEKKERPAVTERSD